MRVLGIDCGSEHTGYGVVDLDPTGKLHCVAVGAIHASARTPIAERLNKIFLGLQTVIERERPEEVAIEDVFFAVNVKSALKLGHVRGVAMLAASSAGLSVAEYAPLSIKSAVVGYGRADKQQVQHMITRLLSLESPPQSPDAADALAIAICHLHTSASLRREAVLAR
jgi:crossover junction endodeoxyribonuclease RuvC